MSSRKIDCSMVRKKPSNVSTQPLTQQISTEADQEGYQTSLSQMQFGDAFTVLTPVGSSPTPLQVVIRYDAVIAAAMARSQPSRFSKATKAFTNMRRSVTSSTAKVKVTELWLTTNQVWPQRMVETTLRRIRERLAGIYPIKC